MIKIKVAQKYHLLNKYIHKSLNYVLLYEIKSINVTKK